MSKDIKHFASRGFVQDTNQVHRVEVGKKLYLFHNNKGKAQQLLIWSHGGQVNNKEEFTPASPVTLAWLAPHGSLLAAEPLSGYFDSDICYAELTAPSTQIRNYVLTKMPGHQPSNQESYTTAQLELSSVAGFNAGIEEVRRATRPGAAVDRLLATRKIAMDVLSVRNRTGRSDMTLKEALKEVEAAFPGQYKLMMLAFCRGEAGVEIDKNLHHSAGQNKKYAVPPDTATRRVAPVLQPQRFTAIPGYSAENLLPAPPVSRTVW